MIKSEIPRSNSHPFEGDGDTGNPFRKVRRTSLQPEALLEPLKFQSQTEHGGSPPFAPLPTEDVSKLDSYLDSMLEEVPTTMQPAVARTNSKMRVKIQNKSKSEEGCGISHSFLSYLFLLEGAAARWSAGKRCRCTK